MNENKGRHPRAFQEAMNKFIEEKPMSERIKEPGTNGLSLDSKISEIPQAKPEN
jgi:hypothetical protein